MKMTNREFDIIMSTLLPDSFTCLNVENIIGVKNMEELLIASEADALFVDPMGWPGEDPPPVRTMDAAPIMTKLSRCCKLKKSFFNNLFKVSPVTEMDYKRINAFLLWNAYHEAMGDNYSFSDFSTTIMNTIIMDVNSKYRLGEDDIVDAIFLCYDLIENNS